MRLLCWLGIHRWDREVVGLRACSRCGLVRHPDSLRPIYGFLGSLLVVALLSFLAGLILGWSRVTTP